VTALPWGEPLTYDDLQGMPDDGHRYELVDGVLLVTPAPGSTTRSASWRSSPSSKTTAHPASSS